jgi:predicted nucleic acid-binding protein
MGAKFLIDTNAIIDFSEGRLSELGHSFLVRIIEDDPCISAITKIELLGFSSVSQAIIDFTDVAVVYGLTDVVVDRTIELRKQHRIKLPDAIIAATALTYEMTLISRNSKDFQSIDQLACLDLYKL